MSPESWLPHPGSWAQPEGSRLPPRRGLARNVSTGTLTLDFQSPEPWETNVYCFSLTNVVLCDSSPRWLGHAPVKRQQNRTSWWSLAGLCSNIHEPCVPAQVSTLGQALLQMFKGIFNQNDTHMFSKNQLVRDTDKENHLSLLTFPPSTLLSRATWFNHFWFGSAVASDIPITNSQSYFWIYQLYVLSISSLLCWMMVLFSYTLNIFLHNTFIYYIQIHMYMKYRCIILFQFLSRYFINSNYMFTSLFLLSLIIGMLCLSLFKI